jgi:hypothetical protein
VLLARPVCRELSVGPRQIVGGTARHRPWHPQGVITELPVPTLERIERMARTPQGFGEVGDAPT